MLDRVVAGEIPAKHHIAFRDADGGVRTSRPVDRERSDVVRPPPMTAVFLVTGVHEEPVEPDLEAFGIAQPRELSPGEKECLLDGVLGPLDIAKDPIRNGVETVAVEIDELLEGDVVASSCPFDQPRPHW